MQLEINTELQSLIPPLSADEYSRLEKSIVAEGCRDAIVVWNRLIVDGHNRYEICKKHGIEFAIAEKEFTDIEAAKDWMDSNQLARRNLTPDQRQILIGRRYLREKLKQGGTGANQHKEQSDQIEHSANTAEKLADEYKVAPITVRRYAETAKKFEQLQAEKPELAKEIFQGKKTFAEAKKEERQMQKAEEKGKYIAVELPAETKYRVVYADPPWKYNDIQATEKLGGAGKHYPTMSIESICSLPVKDMIIDNAVLFLWTTSPLLEETFAVIRAWGFKYKTSFIWDKVRHNMGHYNSVRHELLLVCTKGSCTPDVKKLYDSVIVAEKSDKHSEKPEEFRNIIDTIYPHGKRIEMFARRKAEGWDLWGNQKI